MSIWLQYAIFGAVAGAHFTNKAVFWKYFVFSLPIMPVSIYLIEYHSGFDDPSYTLSVIISVVATFALYQRGTTLARAEIQEHDYSNIEELF